MLNIRSCYAIPKSVIRIGELANACVNAGLSYISICDDDLFGLPELLREAKKNNLKAVFGYRHQTDNGLFSLFIRSKKGYMTLIQLINNKITLNQLLKEGELTAVFSGEKDAYLEYLQHFRSLYYSVEDEPPAEDIVNPVFFRTANMLKDDDLQALELVREIGKYEPSPLETPSSFETLLEQHQNHQTEHAHSNIQRIVEGIQAFDLSVDSMIPLFGNYDKDIPDDNQMLYEHCHSELIKKGLEEDEEYKRRFDEEYSVISKMGFSRYLLLAADIVNTAKEIGAWVGPGRGSAVSSLLVYLLGITQADPIKTGLIFERFLSLDRVDEPDIDIDVDDEMRQPLLERLREKYSKERMVHVITFGTYGEKLIKRELAKRFNIDQNRLPEETKQQLSAKIIGLPHHISTHAAGIIFSQQDLRDLIPLRGLSENSYMTQYDMNALKECGLVKMDILGLITLSMLKKMGIPYEALNLDESEVYPTINSDNLCGIFQLDSRTGRILTEQFTPTHFEEIRIMISLNRPGPSQSGLTEELINRRKDIKKVEYFHPLVKEILSSTWGVPVFQEQIMEMSMILAGFSPKQANDLRKAMAKKDAALMGHLKSIFIKGAAENDMEEDAAQELFEMMAEFAGYAFNKAHATAYALITYWTAYAKYHKPLRFYQTMINASHGKHEKLYHLINEAKKNGVSILKPDINKSHSDTMIEDGALRLGLNLIKDLNGLTIRRIIEERQNDSFRSVEDFLLRMEKDILSDFILKRLFEAHVFDDSWNQFTLNDMIKIRDKNIKTLEKIGAKLFGEVTKKETIKSEKPIQENERNTISFLQEELQSYGFLINYHHVFGLTFNPFLHSAFDIGLVTKEMKLGRYEVCTGMEFAVIHPPVKLRIGSLILFSKQGHELHFKGFLDPVQGEILINQRNLFEFEKTFDIKGKLIKLSGISKINIEANKYHLEVRL